jgi:hypothetical protein
MNDAAPSNVLYLTLARENHEKHERIRLEKLWHDRQENLGNAIYGKRVPQGFATDLRCGCHALLTAECDAGGVFYEWQYTRVCDDHEELGYRT